MTDIPDNWLHIYGQHNEHDAARIRGTKGGLIALRDAIDRALIEKEAEADVFATDGEGYAVKVQLSNTIGGLGHPDYLYLAETEIWQRGIDRRLKFDPDMRGWETSRPMLWTRVQRKMKEPATKTDYVVASVLMFAIFSAVAIFGGK